jgi:hypothetical protein
MYSEECLNYINESLIVDKIRAKINDLKNRKAKCKNKAELNKVQNTVKALGSKVKNSTLSSNVKKALLISIFGLLTTTGHANTFAELQSQYNLKPTTIEYEGSGAFDEPFEEDIIEDAKYLAVATKGANIKGIELENTDVDDPDEDVTRVYNFTNGISITVNIHDAIFVYDNGILIRQYEAHNPAMDALLDVARNF